MNAVPFFKASRLGNGLLCLLHLGLALALVVSTSPALYALTDDGATEALTLWYRAELAIAQEERTGHRDLAGAMQETLPHLLKEYLVTRDGTIALDTVDAAFVREQFKVARAMEEPGVALAMDIYAGEATGFEHGLQTAIAQLADNVHGRASERVVEVYERQLERRLDKVEQDLERAAHLTDKLDAKLDAAAARLALKAERAEAKAEAKAEKAEAKAEAKAEKAEAKAEAKAEKAEAKAEKAEAKAESPVEKVEPAPAPDPKPAPAPDPKPDSKDSGKKK